MSLAKFNSCKLPDDKAKQLLLRTFAIDIISCRTIISMHSATEACTKYKIDSGDMNNQSLHL